MTDFATPPAPLAPEDVPYAKTCGLGELLVLSLGLALLMAGEFAINKPKALFDGPFVLDECLTDLIVRDPSIAHSIQAVRYGVDTNPPVFHLIDRAFWAVGHSSFHESPRITFRAVSAFSIWLALVGAYVILRNAFRRSVSLVGVLAVWAHPDVIDQSTSARFYAPLLLATVAMCIALQIRGNGVIRAILVGLCAAFLCTIHYFGILILAPLVLAVWLIDIDRISIRTIRLLPALAGPILLLPFIPFVRTQSQGLTVKTWIDPFSYFLARHFLADVLCALPLIIALAIWAITQMTRRVTIPITPIQRFRLRVACGPMLALIAVPLVIVLFSAVVQSALVPRYAIAATLALAPLVAMLLENRSRPWLLVAAIGFSALTLLGLHGMAKRRLVALQTLTQERDELQSEQPPLQMVFADRADATELLTFAPPLSPRISIVNQRAPSVALRNFRQYELEMSGKVAQFYPTPPLITPQQMIAMGRFHLVALSEDMQNLLLQSPMRRVEGDVYEGMVR